MGEMRRVAGTRPNLVVVTRHICRWNWRYLISTGG